MLLYIYITQYIDNQLFIFENEISVDVTNSYHSNKEEGSQVIKYKPNNEVVITYLKKYE